MNIFKRLFCKHAEAIPYIKRFGYGKHGALTLRMLKCCNCGKELNTSGLLKNKV